MQAKKQNQQLELKVYQVAAFTDKTFGGNPAAIIPVSQFLDYDTMVKIAIENYLAVTAFVVKNEDLSDDKKYDYFIRWFTPGSELSLCGHATLAASYTIFNKLNWDKDTIVFNSLSGILNVTRNEQSITLNFPRQQMKKIENNDVSDFKKIQQALGIQESDIIEINASLDYLVVLKSQEILESIQPDFNLLKKVDLRGVDITAQSSDREKSDVVSRCFLPKENIDEDIVCGSAHCIITPYWANVLGKNVIKARQMSKRQGQLKCELQGDRVLLTGGGVLFMEGVCYV